ncbi:hypothetical protein Daus18300_010209 [Diaporthe australafricana]|uniref:Protein kinase domain-containing protein n=1 Tax=Diaporthe australafricana TaxID=127596 RepID=A0ABR3WBA1_9PEZI
MLETLEDLQEFFRRAIKADVENGTLFENKQKPIRFYPDDCKRRLNEWFCERIFGLLLSSDPYFKEPGLRKERIQSYYKKICPGLRIIFIILFAFTSSKDLGTTLRLFRENVLEKNLDLSDKSLPLLEASAKEYFGESAGKAFFKRQLELLPNTLQEGEFRQVFPRSRILPWFDEADSFLGEGAYGIVHLMNIVRGHFIFKEPRSRNADNLWHYMTEEAKPTSDADRLRNIKRMLGICQGLDWLHRNLEYRLTMGESQFTAYYHCDLKPDNILVCEDPSTHSLVFRISDFGQARGLRQKSSDGRYRRAGSMIPFPNGQGEYTYLPPECQTRESQASANSTTDVWSFACILLLMVIFNYGGSDAIKEFQTRRHESSLSDEKNDRFYIDSANPRLNPAVINYMKNFEEMPAEPQINNISDMKAVQLE